MEYLDRKTVAKHTKQTGQLRDPYGVQQDTLERNPAAVETANKVRWRRLNQIVFDKIIEAKQVGFSDVNAAAMAGVSIDSLRLWRQLGREEMANRNDPDYLPDPELDDLVIFFHAYVDAGMQVDRQALATVVNAIHNGNEDMAWKWLQARHPEDYNPAKQLQVTGRDGGPLEITPVIQTLPPRRLEMLKIPAGAVQGLIEEE